MGVDAGGVILEAQRAAAEVISLRELAEGPLTLLARHLDAHIVFCYRLVDGGCLEGVSPQGEELVADYRREGGDDPLLEVKTRLNPHLAVTTDLVDRRRLRASHVYRAFYRRLDIEHQLVGRLTPLEYPNPGVTAFVLARGARQGPFSEAGRTVVSHVLPALIVAARRSERLRSVLGERDTLAALVARDGVYAALHLDGRVRWLSPQAERELGAVLCGGALPDALASCLAGLRDLVGKGAAARPGVISLRTEAGEPLALDAGLVPHGQGWLVALTLASPGVSSAVARAAAHHGLRPSEARVLESLSRGKSNAEIARELFVSCETVRTHVHHILRKMRVRRRLEAVARLRRFG